MAEKFAALCGSLHTHLYWTDYGSIENSKQIGIGKVLKYLFRDIERFPRDIERVSKETMKRGINYTGLIDVIAGNNDEKRFEKLMATANPEDDSYTLVHKKGSPVAVFVDNETRNGLHYERTLEIVTGIEAAHVLAGNLPDFHASGKYTEEKAEKMSGKFIKYLRGKFKHKGEKRIERILTYLRRTGCFITIDHPLWNGMGEKRIKEYSKSGLIDALETNGNLMVKLPWWLPFKKLITKILKWLPLAKYNDDAVKLGKELNLPVYHNDDAHCSDDVGRSGSVFYVNPGEKDMRKEIYDAIRNRRGESWGEPNSFFSLINHIFYGRYSLIRNKLGVIDSGLSKATEKGIF